MQCIQPFRVTKNLDRILHPDGLEVPCGKCLTCRIKKRQEWAVRMLHECESHKDSIFITLTYDEEHVPYRSTLSVYPTLKKSDLQKFFKRLRRDLENQNRKIKYFASGEYGDNERPHYHAIIFGLSLREDDKTLIKENWPKCNWNITKIATKSFGLAEPDSLLYVAKYISKQFSGEEADTHYKNKNREPVFRLLSMGLGKEFAEKESKKWYKQGYITVKNIKQSIPRYYLKKYPPPEDYLQKLKNKAEENEAENVERFTGINTSEKAYYMSQKASDVVEYYEAKNRHKKQYALNVQKRLEIKNAKQTQKL